MQHPYVERRERLVRAMAQRIEAEEGDTAAEALLVTDLINVRYLCGFSGSNGALLVTPDHAVLATDARYTEQAANEAPDVELVTTRTLAADLAARAASLDVGRLGFEDAHLTVAAHRALTGATDESGVTLIPAGRMVESLRVQKDESELVLIRRACAIGDLALADLLPTIHPGRTEREIAHALEARLVAHGADEKAFSTIVAAGPNSSIPHHQPTDRSVEPGDFLKIDFGALTEGYHSDMTRTLVVGAEPAAWQQELYELVAQAQRAGRDALEVGAELAAVDSAARSVIKSAGYAEHFSHGLGHGVGLVIHEEPFFAATATGRLGDRNAVTVEPGVYLPGRGGVRIEDTLVVRADQTPELLTQTTKDLVVCR
jgi:Xaa-Pro aminopeptidase